MEVEYSETIQAEESVGGQIENSINAENTHQIETDQTPAHQRPEKPLKNYIYVKEEPKNIKEEIFNLRSHYNHSEENISQEECSSRNIEEAIIPETFNPETIIPDTIVPETIVPELQSSDNSLEPRKRGRPKKKPLSILTPMEISQNHDSRQSTETLENHNEQLYAGFLGRTRRTTRQIQEDIEKESSAESDPDDEDFMDRRGRPYGSVKNRGRGRARARGRGRGTPRGRRRGRESPGIIFSDEEQVNVSLEVEVEADADAGATEVSPEQVGRVAPRVKCGKCQEEMLKREWNRHNLVKHNDTGWLDGETPIDYSSNDALLKKILTLAIKKRKGQLVCESCATVKKSAVGFMSHLRFCGKTDVEKLQLMVQCPRCKSNVKPTSMYTHEKNCQREKSNLSFTYQNDPEESYELVTGQGKSKRKAAEKAVSRITEFTSSISDSIVEKITPQTVNHFIQKPQLKRKIGKPTRDAFNKELEQTSIARCRQVGCEFYGVTFEIICDHFSKCNFQVQENYICKVCNLHSKIHKEIKDHVLEKHCAEGDSDIQIDPDHLTKNEESSESSDEGGNKNVKEKPSSNLKFLPEKPDEKLRAFRAAFLDKELVQSPKTNVPYSAAYRWTLEFELDNYQLNLFKDLMPNELKLLSKQEAELFLPELQQSMAIKNTNCDTFGNEWNYWRRFEGKVEDEVPSFFVGGPIWAMAWLPIPFILNKKNQNQYLAVSTHPKMESEYSVGQAYSGKNIIQIWNLGDLHQKNKELSDPQLSYAVAHNGGTVWCMEWCPSGCYQNEEIFDFVKDSNKSKRMGLLGAACSDGFVHVYSLPFPEDLQAPSEEINQLPIYKVNPVLLLVVNIALLKREKQAWQCTKLTWTKEKGHNILAAGFSNGFIALWNLTTQASYLKQKQGSTTLINSFRHFLAHHHSVSLISLIPYGGKKFLVTSGLDRCYKFWNLEQSSCVESITTRGLTVNGAWLNNWLCSVISYDDSLGLSHTNTQLIPFREHSYKYFPVLATNSPTYALGVSDYANAFAEGTAAGEIVSIFPNQLLYKDIENYLNKKRWLCSYVEVTDFKTSENPVEDQSKKDKKEYQYKPTSYVECSERFGISFSDSLKMFRTCKAKPLKNKVMPSDQLESVSVEQYPFASVNRISWNPNAWSYLWFAAGYQNGFVRILNFNFVTRTDNIDKILPRFVQKVTEREVNENENCPPEQNGEHSQEDVR